MSQSYSCIQMQLILSIENCSCGGNTNRSDTYSEPASQMVTFWRVIGDSGKEECYADDKEQKELNTSTAVAGTEL